MEFKDILSTIKRDENTIINDITTFNYNDNGTLSDKTRVTGKMFTETKCNYDDTDKLSEIVSTTYEGKGMKRSPLGVDKTVYKYDGDNLKNITSYVHLEGKDEYIANTLDYKDNGDETYKSFNEDGSVSTNKFTKIINKDGIAKEITTIKYESVGISEKNKETFYDDDTYIIESISISQNVSAERTTKPDDKYHITLSQSKIENPNATMHISETIEAIDDTHYKFTTTKKNKTGNNIICSNEITTYEIISDTYHIPIGKKVNVFANFNNGTNNTNKVKAKTYVDDKVSVISLGNILVSSKLGNHKVIYETAGAFYDYAIHTEDESTVYNIYYKSGNVVCAYVSKLKEEDNIYDIKLSKSGMSENWIIDCTITHNDNITTTYNAIVSKDAVTDILDLVLLYVADNLKDKLNIDISLSTIDQAYTPILIAGNFDDLNDKLS